MTGCSSKLNPSASCLLLALCAVLLVFTPARAASPDRLYDACQAGDAACGPNSEVKLKSRVSIGSEIISLSLKVCCPGSDKLITNMDGPTSDIKCEGARKCKGKSAMAAATAKAKKQAAAEKKKELAEKKKAAAEKAGKKKAEADAQAKAKAAATAKIDSNKAAVQASSSSVSCTCSCCIGSCNKGLQTVGPAPVSSCDSDGTCDSACRSTFPGKCPSKDQSGSTMSACQQSQSTAATTVSKQATKPSSSTHSAANLSTTANGIVWLVTAAVAVWIMNSRV